MVAWGQLGQRERPSAICEPNGASSKLGGWCGREALQTWGGQEPVLREARPGLCLFSLCPGWGQREKRAPITGDRETQLALHLPVLGKSYTKANCAGAQGRGRGLGQGRGGVLASLHPGDRNSCHRTGPATEGSAAVTLATACGGLEDAVLSGRRQARETQQGQGTPSIDKSRQDVDSGVPSRGGER